MTAGVSTVRGDGHDATLALLKRAIGEGNSIACGNLVLAVRDSVAAFSDGTPQHVRMPLLFGAEQRGSGLVVNEVAVEWPVRDGDRAVSVKGADITNRIDGYKPDKGSRTDPKYHLLPGKRRRQSTSRAAADQRALAIGRQLLIEVAGDAVRNRALLVGAAGEDARRLVAATTAFPADPATATLEQCAATLELVRRGLGTRLETAVASAGPATVASLRMALEADPALYGMFRARGYDLEGIDTVFLTRSGPRRRTISALTLDGIPLEPPATPADLRGSRLKDEWPSLSAAAAERVLADAPALLRGSQRALPGTPQAG